MQKNFMYSVENVKALALVRTPESFDELLKIFFGDHPINIRREAVSSIGRHNDNEKIYNFISVQAFNKNNPMELIYQMFRTCLYKSKYDERFKNLLFSIKNFYNNEYINKMFDFYEYKHAEKNNINPDENPDENEKISRPLLLVGDSSQTLKQLPKISVQLIFTSPPYYNAREYSDYVSYEEYLNSMKKIFIECNRILEDGRFLIINVSPIIIKRAGREFESIRYPIHYDFHKILIESEYYFIDEIIWIKPEPSVPDRVSGYKQTRKPLSYKPNCITESIMIYRKNCNFLLDENMKKYLNYDKHENENIDTSNCWYIAPSSNKNHPAVFPEELCRRILKYYSFEGDVILDPFAGSGTLGRVAQKMGRIPVMCEKNENYADLIIKNGAGYYDVWRGNNKKYSKQINIW